MIVSAYTGGLRGGFTGENLARHPSVSYDKNARFLQARWLLDMHNYHQLTISLRDLEMYAALSLRSRNPQDNLTIWIIIARITLGDFTFFCVTCSLTESSLRTLSTYKLNAQSYLRHAHSNCSWCVQIANNPDVY